jgi:hypothetical protein
MFGLLLLLLFFKLFYVISRVLKNSLKLFFKKLKLDALMCIYSIVIFIWPLTPNMDMKIKFNMCLFMSMKCMLILIKFDIDINNDQLLKTI